MTQRILTLTDREGTILDQLLLEGAHYFEIEVKMDPGNLSVVDEA